VSPGPGEPAVFWDPAAGVIDRAPLEGLDAVVHLAGEPLAPGRWSRRKKNLILASRTAGTTLLAQALAGLDSPPGVLASASATGYYGDRGDCLLNEDSPAGSSFLSGVCSQWEEATSAAAAAGIRVVSLRIGMVLSPSGGALAAMLPAFRVGLGGRFGHGEQYMSWIGIGDVLRAVAHCLYPGEISGPVNLVSPHPVQNREFTRVLARVLGRPAFFHLPSFLLKAVLGPMAGELLLSSTRVEPARLLASGFSFIHPELEPALECFLRRKDPPSGA
ncbi:MAG: TIGR01777 family oxidoreductase, partial [Candidatus Glassbacteria bacterium]|nr:TIGR01777 family oxidoreductase [Candidatus Glassbacteria bacterium]